MNASSEIRLTVFHELKRNLRSGKGLAASLLFLAGGAMAMLVYVFAVQAVSSSTRTNAGGAIADETYRLALRAIYNDETANYLAHAPPVLWWLYKASLFFVPTLVMLMGYDQIAGELRYRTLRYAALRARRTSLVIGRAIGNWIACSAMSLGLCAFAWVFTLVRGDGELVQILEFGVRFWLVGAVFSGVYVGLTALFSTLFESSILALLTSMGTGIALWIVGASGHLPHAAPWLRYVSPGEYDAWLLSPDPLDVLAGAAVLLGIAVAGIASAALSLRRRDI